MKRPIVFFFVLLGKGSWARVDLNGVPLYRHPYLGPHSRSGPANYLLKPGENVVEVELLKVGDPDPGYDEAMDAFKFQLYLVNNPGDGEVERLDREVLLDLSYPKILDEAPEEHRHLPFYHRRTVQLDLPLHEPLFVQAPTSEFGCEGTLELRQAVEQLYRYLETKDYDGLLTELSFKFACDEKAAEGEDAQRASTKMQRWREELFPYEPVPSEPLDMSMIHFEACRDGQVAYVTRHDEGFPLDAVCEKDPLRRIRTDLLMVQHQGRWKVFA